MDFDAKKTNLEFQMIFSSSCRKEIKESLWNVLEGNAATIVSNCNLVIH